ncbi:MAG: glycosyltransferase [Deltaproteobacteria bacterium]|nr:glycosyltransferase [Deltaproteobacteria bacterium]
MKTSIIICFYERLQHLKLCLDSLKNCAGDFDEVVITDDGSSESCVHELEKMIARYDFPIVHAWQPDEGFRAAAARNNGIRHAAGDYLIFLDCDFLVLPDTIKYHIKNARPGRYLSGLCKYLAEDRTNELFRSAVTAQLLEEYYRSMPEWPMIKEHWRFLRRKLLRNLGLAGTRTQSLGGHFSIYREDMEYVNGYDENFVGWGGEDEDLGLRLLLAGFGGYSVIRGARVLHMWHPRELGGKHWQDGPNVEYFRRDNIPFFCENGLIKSDKV